MPALKEKAITLLGSVSFNMKTAASTTVFTVPTGKVCRITHAVFRDLSGAPGGAATSYSITGFRQTFSLANFVTANTGYLIVQGTDLTEWTEQAAATNIQITVTTGSTNSVTATIDLFGYLT